jgi:site-specific DNA recombinase
MRAVAYLRVSTDEQAQSGLGLEAQAHACRQWAAREGFDLAGPFADDVSGAAPLDRRPGLLDAIAALGQGDHLLMAKRDGSANQQGRLSLRSRERAGNLGTPR